MAKKIASIKVSTLIYLEALFLGVGIGAIFTALVFAGRTSPPIENILSILLLAYMVLEVRSRLRKWGERGVCLRVKD